MNSVAKSTNRKGQSHAFVSAVSDGARDQSTHVVRGMGAWQGLSIWAALPSFPAVSNYHCAQVLRH